MNDISLPTYSDVQAHYRARAELKQNFATLRNDQLDIQELFKTVAAELEATSEIGERHPLSKEWDALRQVRASGLARTVPVQGFDGGGIRARRGIGRFIASLSRTLGSAPNF